MMRKEYVKPTAEKINFDYVESVVACPSGCPDPTHWDHQGYAYGSCGMSAGNGGNNNNNNNDNNNNNNNNGDSNTQAMAGGNPCYYAPGWGLGC